MSGWRAELELEYSRQGERTVPQLRRHLGPLIESAPAMDELILVESGGYNLAATFSPELSDFTIYVIDVAAGDKIPREGGPGIMKSDLLAVGDRAT